MANPSDDAAESVIAACVQFDVRRGDVAANLTSASDGLRSAAAAGSRICVLPEMWSTSFVFDCSPALVAAAASAEATLLGLSASLGMLIVGSSMEPTTRGVFNTARVYDRGKELGAYRKIHLFSPHAEHRHHTPGEQPLILDTDCGRLAVMICYDLRFPDLARYYFHKGAEVLLVPAQWPEARSQHWRTLLRARAIENECFVVGCNRTGQDISLRNEDALAFPGDGRIVDPTGEILVAGSGEDGVLTATLELRTVRTMRRILPVARDQRPSVYRRLWDDAWSDMTAASRESEERDV